MARPREFNKDDALYKTMLIFWRKGYDGTSIPDLLEAAGISRSSLYETFTDKQTLFIEAMKIYRNFVGSNSIQIILDYLADPVRKNEPAMDIIRKYFNGRIDMALDRRYPGGCFITNTATSLETADEKVRSAVVGYIRKTEDTFRDILNRCRDNGEITRDSDINALTAYLIAIANGINVLSRTGKDRSSLDNIVKTALKNISI